MASTISTASSTAETTPLPPRRGIPVPRTLILLTAGLAVVAGIPTAILGGSDAVGRMALGAAVSLASVLGGFHLARLAFRGPDRFATKLVVGGFITRMVLLFGISAAVVSATGVSPASFVMWLVTFYFALILVEAWILARQPLEIRE